MAKNKYEQLANEVIDLIGGKANLSDFTHCVTRLRLNIKDRGLVQAKEIEKLEGVLGCQWQGEQFQIIIGPSVRMAYDLICKKAGIEVKGGDNVNTDLEKKKTKFSVMSVIDVISGCITPALPIMIGAGMLKVILLLLQLMNVLTPDSATFTTLTFVSDTAFYFLPVYVGAASAKKFGSNMWIGMFFGAVLIHPSFIAMCEVGGIAGSVFGIPIFAGNYASSIFPVILTVFVASHIERFIAKYCPAFLRAMMVPLLTILIMTPIMLCGLAPLGAIIGNYLADGIIWLYNSTGFVGLSLFTAVLPLLIITGMHHSMNPYIFQCFATLGHEPLVLVATFVNNINQGIACMAVGLKSKSQSVKGTAFSSGITALLCGVTEPGLFGVTLKHRTPLYAAMIGNLAGGLVAGIFHVVIYAFAGSWGVFGLLAFIGENPRNFIYMVLSVIVGAIVTFIATLILYKDQKAEV